MAYDDELAIPQKETNVIMLIDGDYFANKQPDSGLVIPTENLIVDDPKINGVDVDIRRASTPVGSLNFKFKDNNEFITKKIMLDENNFLTKEVVCYVGFITGNFDFSNYKEVARARINSLTKVPNGYSIRAKEVTSLISNPSYNISDKLDIDILIVSTTLDLQDASLFPDSGFIKIGDEFIRYSGKLDNTLLNLNRGEIGSPAEHDDGADVFLATELIDTNPITMLLQLMLSKDGDLANHPTYDVLKNGLGIDSSLIDISKFEDVETSFFDGELQRLYLYNETDTLRWIEKEILQPTNARIFTDNGKISITVLDQIEPAASVREVNEDFIIGVPTWSLTSDKIHNVIKIFYDYNESSGRYLSNLELKNQDSVNTFGEKKPLIFKYKGLHSDIGGGALISKRAEQLLTRLGTARGKVSFRALFDTENISLGEDVLLNHRFLPQQGGGLGINEQIEVISKSVDLKQGTCLYKLEYTSFTGIRLPFIAPSPLITSVINQKSFTVPDASCYSVGHALVLWDTQNNDYLPDAVNYVESIEGNVLTMVNDFSTPLSTNIRLKLPDYDSSNNDQKSRYSFIGTNTGFFDDGTKSYQIIF